MAKTEEEVTFEELGLDASLIRALRKKGFQTPTPIQRDAIPKILEGKDVLGKAHTGSGKTIAYLLPLLQKLLLSGSGSGSGPTAIVLVSSSILRSQVHSEINSLLRLCGHGLRVAEVTDSLTDSELVFSRSPQVVISTPACISTCLSRAILHPNALEESLSMLVLDEADLLLSYLYEDDLRALIAHVPRACQCILMSATFSDDVTDKLKSIIALHNPDVTLLEVDGGEHRTITPISINQYSISCGPDDKLVYILALLKLELVQKKVLIFTNTMGTGFRLKLFLEKFGIKTATLNAKLPKNSQEHILKAFNAGLFDYLIGTDLKEVKRDGEDLESEKCKNKRKLVFDPDSSISRGVDFQSVHTVVNFEMPPTVDVYIHRIGRTGRAHNTGASVSLVSPDEMEFFEELKSTFAKNRSGLGDLIAPFPYLTKNAVDSLRYRAEDMGRSVTHFAVIEAQAQDIRNEMLNSEKLKARLEANKPRDLELLKHDKVIGKKEPPLYMRDIPEYLLDPATQEASKTMVKRYCAGKGNESGQHPAGRKRRVRKSRDPIKAKSGQGTNERNRMSRKGSEKLGYTHGSSAHPYLVRCQTRTSTTHCTS